MLFCCCFLLCVNQRVAPQHNKSQVGQRIFVARHFLGFVGHDKAELDLHNLYFYIQLDIFRP